MKRTLLAVVLLLSAASTAAQSPSCQTGQLLIGGICYTVRTVTVTPPQWGRIRQLDPKSNPMGDAPIDCGYGSRGVCSFRSLHGNGILLGVEGPGAFQGWGGACSGTSNCWFLVDANKTVSASFAPPQFPVTVSPNPHGGAVGQWQMPAGGAAVDLACGGGQGVCTRSWPAGTVVTLRAMPFNNFQFTGWTSCPGTRNGTYCTFTLDEPKTVSASFAPASAKIQ